MTYVLTDENQNVVTYPYSLGMLRRDNPNTSFPASPSQEVLNSWNVFEVETKEETFDPKTHKAVEQNPKFYKTTQKWTQVWSVTAKTQEEIDQQNEIEARQIRNKRNALLEESDWTQVADAPVNQLDWASYRQQLRDITIQENFPNDVIWPTIPE